MNGGGKLVAREQARVNKVVQQRYLRGADDPKLRRELITPEGVPIEFTLAGAGDRAAAFVLDTLIQLGVLFVMVFLLSLVGAGGEDSWLMPFFVVFSFLLFNFYFAFFEMRWQGRTPGKRAVGITVIDGRGGQLLPSAILARNLVRYIEVWLPLSILLGGTDDGTPRWVWLVTSAWVLVIMLLPLFNKDRLRVGDLIAGTKVVRQPKAVLLPDLAAETRPVVAWGREAAVRPTFTFTAAQLDVYGIYELQVLEGVLRTDQGTLGQMDATAAVAQKIANKIRYDDLIDDRNQERFLRDFYTALRGHLEKKMLFGNRREDKFSRK